MDPYPVYIHSMAYNHNGTLLVTGGADGMVRLFGMLFILRYYFLKLIIQLLRIFKRSIPLYSPSYMNRNKSRLLKNQ